MKSKFEKWFTQQNFYDQLKYIHGDRLFDFDDGIGYRNLTVQVGYVAWCGRDVEFVLGGDQVAKNISKTIATKDNVVVGVPTKKSVLDWCNGEWVNTQGGAW